MATIFPAGPRFVAVISDKLLDFFFPLGIFVFNPTYGNAILHGTRCTRMNTDVVALCEEANSINTPKNRAQSCAEH